MKTAKSDNLKNQTNETPFELKICDVSEIVQTSWHFDTEFILFLSGECTLRCGSNSYKPTSGDIYIINSGKIHMIDPVGTGSVKYIYLIPDRDFFLTYGIDTSKITFTEKISDAESAKKFIDFVSSFEDSKKESNYISTAKYLNNLLSLLIDLCEKYTEALSGYSQEKATATDYIRETVKYILENSNKAINLDQLSSHIGLSKYHLIREFKKYTGNTIISYVNTVKCHRAERFILSGMSVEEAAFASGFNSVSHFSKTYKKLNGNSPISIRKPKTARN